MESLILFAKRFICLFLMLIFSGAVSAETVMTGTITRLQNYEYHDGTLFVLSNMAGTSGYCTRNDYYILPLAHKYYSEDYSLLLAAKIANRPVNLVLEIGDCLQGLPRIRHVYIE